MCHVSFRGVFHWRLNKLKGGSTLRTKFESYLTLRRYAPKTKAAYISAVKGFSKFHHFSPDKLDNEQIQSYLQHLTGERKLAWSSVNQAFSGLYCFYGQFLKMEEKAFSIPPRQRQIPMLLSREEVKRLIDSVTNLKHHVILMAVYSAGLRVSEVVHLKPLHIESSRKMIRVEQGKGRKDRYTILSEKLLLELRRYWRLCRPGEEWLFPGRDKQMPLSISSVQKVYNVAKEKVGIKRGRGVHTLRHCFATHLLDQGVDIYTIKRLLGHTSIATTMKYLHISREKIASVISPLDMDDDLS